MPTILSSSGIPIRPDLPMVTSTKQGTATMTLSTAASGAGTTGSFVFLVNSTPPMEMMPSSYSFPSYTDGQKVSVVINNIKVDVTYTFMVSASNKYGISAYVEASIIGGDECSEDACVNMSPYLCPLLQLLQHHQIQLQQVICVCT